VNPQLLEQLRTSLV
jgi:Ca2+-binding EF-hand superfamily protein